MKNAWLLLIMILVSCGRNRNEQNRINPQADTIRLTVLNEVPATPIKQQISGTCWAYSTASFLESEIYRVKGRFVELSAMNFVHNAYLQKAENYILRQGAARFTEGGCNYDPLVAIDSLGIMPFGIYRGDTLRDHQKLLSELYPRVFSYVDREKVQEYDWRQVIPSILDEYLGKPVDSFEYEGSRFTPKTFWESTGLKSEDYVNLTSFLHVLPYKYNVLSIPANWSNAAYFNVPLDEYMENIDYALEHGYSLAVAMDLTEPELSIMEGFAFMSSDSIVPPERRQKDFESFRTTDDHNMHIIGKVRDESGKLFYKCKNSWGTSFGLDGCYYISASYMRMKSIYVMLHKDGLMEATKCRLLAEECKMKR